MNYKAVIFDLDGTLLDSLQDIANTLNSVLKNNGLPVLTIDTVRNIVGYGMRELIRKAIPEDHPGDDSFIAKLWKEMENHYAESWMLNTRPYAGIPELLDWLDSADIRKGVLSNKPDRFTKLCVTTLLPHWTFESVIGHMPLLNRKPDPEGALEMASSMESDPPETLFIGDTDVDMQTAVAAGMYPLGVLWGFRSAEELIENGAKKLVDTPLEIITWLSQNNP